MLKILYKLIKTKINQKIPIILLHNFNNVMLLWYIAITLFLIFAILFINHQTFDAPDNIVLTIWGSMIVLLGYLWSLMGIIPTERITAISNINFSEIVLELMLWVLLFVGAMNFSAKELNKNKWNVVIFATLGTIISAWVVGWSIYLLSWILGLNFSLEIALLFWAIVSPTDPIAIISMLKKAGIPKQQLTLIEWESLFNDWIGVVLFVALLSIISAQLWIEEWWHQVSPLLLLTQEVWWGILLWSALWLIGHWLADYLKSSVSMITLMMLVIIFWWGFLAIQFHVSWPLAMVIVWLIIWNQVLIDQIDDISEKNLRSFRELIEKIFTWVLFLLIWISILNIIEAGLQRYVYTIVLIITLLGRALWVWWSIVFTRCIGIAKSKLIPLMTIWWLKWAISIALAMTLTIPRSEEIIALTSAVVLFSIIIQWLNLPWVIKKLNISKE